MTQQPYPTAPAAPPPPAASTGVTLSPELQEQMARLQAASAHRTRETTYEKRDDEWFSAPKPAGNGMTTETYLLVLPRSMTALGSLPFVSTAQHPVMVKGKNSSVICPRRDAVLRNPHGTDPLPECPLCDAAEFAFARMREYPKGNPEGDVWKRRGSDLVARDRHFANVFDLTNVTSHWKVDKETNTGRAVPKIWGFGVELQKKMGHLVGEVGVFWHPSGFTRLKLLTTKNGPDTRNVKYDLTVTMPIGGVTIPPGYEAVLENLIDLEHYTRVRPVDELRALVPGFAREGTPGAMLPPPSIMDPNRQDHAMAQPPPPPQPAYPPQAPAYPPQAPAYPPQVAAPQPAYPPQAPAYPPQVAAPQPAYPPQVQTAYPPQAPAYPPQPPAVAAPQPPPAYPQAPPAPPAMPPMPPQPPAVAAPPAYVPPSPPMPPPVAAGAPPWQDPPQPPAMPPMAPPGPPTVPTPAGAQPPSPPLGIQGALPALPPLPPLPPR